MKSACNREHGDQVSEMAIVDTFTRLIFGEQSDFSESEGAIIDALRQVDPNVTPDSLAEMGRYLQALGVAEMIELVARVRHRLARRYLAVIVTPSDWPRTAAAAPSSGCLITLDCWSAGGFLGRLQATTLDQPEQHLVSAVLPFDRLQESQLHRLLQLEAPGGAGEAGSPLVEAELSPGPCAGRQSPPGRYRPAAH